MKQQTKNRMGFFFAVMFLFNMAASFAHPVTPTLIQTLRLSDYMFGLALAAMTFTNFLFAPFWGKISDYISSRRTLLICCFGYALGQWFFGLARTELQFLAARMFAGVFIGGAYTCFLTYVANCSEEDYRGRNIAVSATIQSVAGAFGYFAGGMIGEIDIFLSVWIQAALLALSGVLFFLFMCDDGVEKPNSLTGDVLKRECNPFSAFWNCGKLMTRKMAVLFLFYGLSNFGYTAFEQCFNYYLRDQFGLSSGYNGVIKAALGVISLIANSTVCMWILKRNNASRHMIGVMLVCSVSMVGVILINALVPFIVVNVLFFAFYFISLPLAQNMVAELGRGKDSNLILGAFNSVKSFGGIFGALFAGFAYGTSPKLPFVLGFLGFALATLFAACFHRIDGKGGVSAP